MGVYLGITNVGSAPTDLDKIIIGYKSTDRKIPFLWHWLKYQTVCRSDFVMKIGEDTKIYPNLMQRNQLTDNKIETYLKEGQRCNGMVYFEGDELYGNKIPYAPENQSLIKIKVYDVYGKSYSKKAKIPKVTINAARKVCKKFGEPRDSLIN